MPEPTDNLLTRVRQAWQDVLGTADVPLETSFFESGGNSLLLAMLQDELSQLAGRRLELAELYRANTVLDQAHLLTN
ncbi:acyl carrier protein [Kitasatospora sp. MAA4]|uniref:acyl carrier protein n=1 Tax=Kitasatospora sp. MAA4 TaxID=3035093 RepID=UPI002475E0F5|nr:acyl carrier protein [Kitasatospora sp. MAA4]MDH6136206.1 acyl carrier protein [Kitasatospora sp. MAA4]